MTSVLTASLAIAAARAAAAGRGPCRARRDAGDVAILMVQKVLSLAHKAGLAAARWSGHAACRQRQPRPGERLPYHKH